MWAVQALAHLNCKDVLIEYLLKYKNIPDPDLRFSEEAVESAAARSLIAWPCEEVYQVLKDLSKRRMLLGLIDALAEYKNIENIAYFEQALDDDYYRSSAEEAFIKLGPASREALVLSAVTSKPDPKTETDSSLRRRRSTLRILFVTGILPEHWDKLSVLLKEKDGELVLGASKLGINFATGQQRTDIVNRMMKLIISAPWHLQNDAEEVLTAFRDKAIPKIDFEINRRMEQHEDIRYRDAELKKLLTLRNRLIP